MGAGYNGVKVLRLDKHVDWDKLVRLWREDDLKPRVLAERFGISYGKVKNYLVRKYGTTVANNAGG